MSLFFLMLPFSLSRGSAALFFFFTAGLLLAFHPASSLHAQTGPPEMQTFYDEAGHSLPVVESDVPLLFSQADALSDETIISMEDAAAPAFSAWGGDDFIVPEVFESWQIEAVLIAGSPGNSPALMEAITLRFYELAPNGTGPAAEPLAVYEDLSFTDQNDDNRFLYIELPEPLLLSSGHYWLAAAVHGNSEDDQLWFWRLNNSERHQHYHWINPGGGYDTFFESWRSGTQVYPDFDEQDLAFQIFGFETLDTSIAPEPEIAGEAPAQLFQNYPNPFNPTTTISYRLHETAPVRIEVYSVHGQRLQVLKRGVQPPGLYEFSFDAAAELASGTYIYRLQVNEHVFSRRMTLLK